MLSRNHTTPPGMLIAGIILCAALARPAAAQPLDQALAAQAYTVVENWISRVTVPEQAPAVQVDDVAAVVVTLRFEGVMLGQSVAAVEDPLIGAQRPHRDLMPLLQHATREALADAQQSLTVLGARLARRSLPAQLQDIAPLLMLDIQFLRTPQRVNIQGADKLPPALALHIDGLAMRRDPTSADWAWIGPGTAQAANLDLQDQLQRLMGRLDLSVDRLNNLAAEGSPRLYRCRALQMIRLRTDQPVVALHRGQAVLPAVPLDAAQIADLSRQWAEWLVNRQQPDGRFVGTYHPTSDRFEPAQAAASEAALACLALARYGRLGPSDSQTTRSYTDAAYRGLTALLKQLNLDSPDNVAALTTLSVAEAATVLLAMLETPDAAELKSARDQLAGVLLAAQDADGAFRAMADDKAPVASRPIQALAALAMVRTYDRTRAEEYLQSAQRALARLWTQPTAAGATMPWAALAEFDLLRLDKATPGLLVVRQTLDSLWTHQVRAESASSVDTDPGSPGYVSPDVVGGFLLEGESLPEPTWRSAGPLVAAAAALGARNVVEADKRPSWLLDTALGLRFLNQLTMNHDSAWYVHDLDNAVGGVRTAMWDNRQPLSATALALLAAAEFQHALAPQR